MASEPATRILRKITALAVLPAFPMAIASGIKFHSVLAFLSMAPLGVSLSASVLWLYARRNGEGDDGNKPKRPRLWLLVDLVSCMFYVGVLIPFWIIEPRRPTDRYRYGRYIVNPTGMMLETYMSCFLILNMVIHAYLVSRNIVLLGRFWVVARECPNCAATRRLETGGAVKGPKYSLLGEYRDSSETLLESARRSMDA